MYQRYSCDTQLVYNLEVTCNVYHLLHAYNVAIMYRIGVTGM